MNKKKPRVGISIGDINGVGVEIFLKTVSKKGLLEIYTPILFGSTKVCSYYKNFFNQKEIKVLKFQGIKNLTSVKENQINVINLWNEEIKITPGLPTKEGGKYALISLRAALEALKTNQIDTLVTLPINKNLIHGKEFSFLGHTEYLQTNLEGEALMFMIHDKIKIALASNHIPLNKVSSELSPSKLKSKIILLENSLKKDFAISRPKIAVLALNPHCGDGGLIGEEDNKIIKPTIDEFFQKGSLVFGPYPADGFFGNENYRNFDGVLAMYHDQGLIPFKTLVFNEGVNFTAGLSHVRTSPDHGVAYDIAGKKIAEENSFLQAIFSSIEIFKNRSTYLNNR